MVILKQNGTFQGHDVNVYIRDYLASTFRKAVLRYCMEVPHVSFPCSHTIDPIPAHLPAVTEQ